MPENWEPVVHTLQDPVDLRATPAAYLARLSALVRDSSTPWIAWSGALFPGRQRPASDALEAALAGVGPAILCLAGGENKPQAQSWLSHFSSGRCIPWLWRRYALLALLNALRHPLPTPFYLPFQLAFAVSPSAIGHAGRHGPALTSLPAGAVRARRSALPHILPVVAASVRPPAILSPGDESPAISVALCAYNEADRIAWAIASVLAQSDSSWELLIVDDGSTDETAATARACVRQDPRVTLLQLPANQGKAHALNHALAAARGRFLLELDADDWLPPHAVKSMREAMDDAAQSVSLLTFDHFVWRRARSGELLPRGVLPASAPVVSKREARVPIPRLYRTSALRELGGWQTTDASGGRLFEDVAITREVQRRGAVARGSGALYHRVIRQSSVSQTHRTAYRPWAERQFHGM